MYLCVWVSVCQGMSNQLNLLGTPKNHYDNMLRMFSNCSVVLENLEVTYTEKHHSLAFLQVSIRTHQIRISSSLQCEFDRLWDIKRQPGGGNIAP